MAAALHEAGEQTRDLCWRMPLDAAYGEVAEVKLSPISRISAVRSCRRVDNRREVPGKIHGVALSGRTWISREPRGISGAAKGATGRPVPLLVHHVLNNAAKGRRGSRR